MRLDSQRFEPTFCVTRWDDVEAADPLVQGALAELEEAGVEFIGLERHGRDLRPWKELVSRLRRDPIDIMHAHKFASNAWGALIAGPARVPTLIAHEHSWSFEGRPVRRFLDRWLIGRRADIVVAVSSEDRRRMIEIEGLDPNKLVMIPNGIATPTAGRPGAVRAELGIEPDQLVIGTVATLRPYKGVDVLIRAAALVVDRFPDLRVLVAGGDEGTDTTVRAGLVELIDELGLADNVILLGFRSDIPDVIEAMDIGVCSSDFEGSPLSVMEYMEAAKPVVATSVGGIPDLISEGEHGLLVPRRDPEALAAALAQLLGDPERRRQMGLRGQERRRREFSVEATVEHVEDLYERLAGARA